MRNFINILFVSIFVENALLMRALGTRRMLVLINKPKKLPYFALFIILITVAHTGLIWWTNHFFGCFFDKLDYYVLFLPFILIFCMSIIYLFIYNFLRLFFKEFLGNNLNLIISSTFNTLIFGTLLLNFSHSYSFFESLIFGVGSQIGFMIATALIVEGNKRLELSKISLAFKGIPITLIYIGILSLAFYGLVGHMLPTVFNK